jgi:hypothetical protein
MNAGMPLHLPPGQPHGAGVFLGPLMCRKHSSAELALQVGKSGDWFVLLGYLELNESQKSPVAKGSSSLCMSYPRLTSISLTNVQSWCNASIIAPGQPTWSPDNVAPVRTGMASERHVRAPLDGQVASKKVIVGFHNLTTRKPLCPLIAPF